LETEAQAREPFSREVITEWHLDRDEILERRQIFRELLIEEQSHVSGRRNALRPAFTFGGVSKTRPNIFRLQLREFLEDLSLVFSSRQVPENIADGDPSSTHAGLSESNRRIDADAIQEAHIRQSRADAAGRQSRGCGAW
jgi:hypothetical protein